MNVKDKVYIINDVDQRERVITGVLIRPSDMIYCVGCGTEESWHYDFELSTDKSFKL